MACPGGCSGGGGQPIQAGCEMALSRGEKLYGLDTLYTLRFSHENPEIKEIYNSFFQKPNSEKAHKLLHTDFKKWQLK